MTNEREVGYFAYDVDDKHDEIEWDKEEWIPAAKVMKELVSTYADARDGDRKRAEVDVVQALLRRLSLGQLWARSPNWKHRLELILPEGAPIPPFDPMVESTETHPVISSGFWGNIDHACNYKVNYEIDKKIINTVECDWVAGDFYLLLRHDNLEPCEVEVNFLQITNFGYAYGVSFNRSGLPSSTFEEGQSAPRNKTRDDGAARLPHLSGAMLLTWWSKLDAATKNLPLDTLWTICRVNHPNHSISRDRIRALAPGRKPGPKPISGETTA